MSLPPWLVTNPWAAQAPYLLLGLFCLGCVVTDLREQKIYNPWTLGFMVLGLALHAALGGLPGATSSALGMALGFAALFPFWAAGGIGAGDVKMLMAVGALGGWRYQVGVCLWGGLAGALLAAAVLLWDSRRFGGVAGYLLLMQSELRDKVPRAKSQRSKLPYGVAIAAGALLAGLRPVLTGGG